MKAVLVDLAVMWKKNALVAAGFCGAWYTANFILVDLNTPKNLVDNVMITVAYFTFLYTLCASLLLISIYFNANKSLLLSAYENNKTLLKELAEKITKQWLLSAARVALFFCSLYSIRTLFPFIDITDESIFNLTAGLAVIYAAISLNITLVKISRFKNKRHNRLLSAYSSKFQFKR